MLALSVRQPWAGCIIAGWKALENRSWKPGAHAIGKRVAIHASAKKPQREDLAEVGRILSGKSADHRFNELTALVIGSARLVRVWRFDEWAGGHGARVALGPPGDWNRTWRPWAQGPYCWEFADPERWVAPVPAKGKLNLWQFNQGE